MNDKMIKTGSRECTYKSKMTCPQCHQCGDLKREITNDVIYKSVRLANHLRCYQITAQPMLLITTSVLIF